MSRTEKRVVKRIFVAAALAVVAIGVTLWLSGARVVARLEVGRAAPTPPVASAPPVVSPAPLRCVQEVTFDARNTPKVTIRSMTREEAETRILEALEYGETADMWWGKGQWTKAVMWEQRALRKQGEVTLCRPIQGGRTVKGYIDLGMLADIDTACKAWRAYLRNYDLVPEIVPGLPEMKRAMNRLERVRRYYSQMIKKYAVPGNGIEHVRPVKVKG